MVSLHHNGLNGILADEMVRVIFPGLMMLTDVIGPGQNSANNIFSVLFEASS